MGKTTNPWDIERGKKVNIPLSQPWDKPIEPGVYFFLRMLRKLKAQTFFSCEGHPNGFYITFKCPTRLARRISSIGYFAVQFEKQDQFSLRIGHPFGSEREKRQCLRWAADAWVKEFGIL